MTYSYRTNDDERLHRRSMDFVRFAEDLRQIARESSLDTESKARLLAESALWSARARNIERSAKLPMSIALFGPSQCGKSYLVGEVARGTAPALDIRCSNRETFDFLKDLNPPGGEESTAQVTRFTCFDSLAEDSDFPFHIRLLSATDLVKILANAFAHECRSSENDVDPQQLAQAVMGQDVKAGNGTPFTDVDLYDIQHYVTHELSQCAYFARLAQAGFWRILADRSRVSSLTDQIALICWLWFQNDAMSRLFRRCLMVVKKIESEDLWVERAALIPRERGILYVQNLRTHLRKAADEQVRVHFGNGVHGRLPKSVLAALTAEVCLSVEPGRTHEFMEFCDILDFPGATARHADYEPDMLNQEPAEGEADKLSEVFLRGKIGYLFDRYTELRDISSLVLCSPPGGAPQAGSLPHLAYKWISLTHGLTSAQRRGKPVTLYVVFTKFDMSLEQKVGEEPDSTTRWSARLKTGFEDFYGKVGDNWPVRWDGRPFTNCFWVRNPQVDQLVFKSGNGSEEVRDEYTGILPQMAAAYSKNEYVRRYFPSVAQSWATVATPGETGIRHLLQRMTENLRPEQKRMILHADMNSLKDEIEIKLKPWLDPSSGQRAEEQAQVCCEALSKAVGRFGRMLESLCISEHEVERLYVEAADAGIHDAPREIGGDSFEDQDDDDIIIIGKPIAVKTPRESVEKVKSNGESVDSFGSAGHFASLVLSKWEEILRDTYGNTALHKRTRLSESWYRTVTEEMLKGVRETYDLRSRIALEAKTALAHPLPKASAKAQAMMAANTIDDFVNYLGQAPFELPELGNDAPKVEGDGFPGLAYMECWMKRLEDLFVRNSGGPSSDVRALIEFSKELKIHIEVNGPRLSE